MAYWFPQLKRMLVKSMNKKIEISYAGRYGRRNKVLADLIFSEGAKKVLLTDPEDNPGEPLCRTVCDASSTVYWNFLRDCDPNGITWIAYFPIGKRYTVDFLRVASFDDTVRVGIGKNGSMLVLKPVNNSVIPYRFAKMSWNGSWYYDPRGGVPGYDLIRQINNVKSDNVNDLWGKEAAIKGSLKTRMFLQGGSGSMALQHAWFGLETKMLTQGRLAVILSEEIGYKGTSITNMIEHAASFAYWNYLDGFPRESIVFIEKYCRGATYGGEEQVQEVCLTWNNEEQKYCSPIWKPIHQGSYLAGKVGCGVGIENEIVGD